MPISAKNRVFLLLYLIWAYTYWDGDIRPDISNLTALFSPFDYLYYPWLDGAKLKRDLDSLLSFYLSHVLCGCSVSSLVDLGTGFYSFCDVVQPVHYFFLLFLMTVVFSVSKSATSHPYHCHCQCFSRHGANLGARSTWDRRLCVFSISEECKGHSNLSRTRETDLNISSQILSYSLALFAILLFFSLHDLRHMTWERSLLSKGNWKRTRKYWSESLLIYVTFFCVLFFFLLFMSFLSSCMARYLFMSLPLSLCGFPRSYPKMSRISDVGVISYLALVYSLHLQWESVAYA